jgi:hypothetical protein
MEYPMKDNNAKVTREENDIIRVWIKEFLVKNHPRYKDRAPTPVCVESMYLCFALIMSTHTASQSTTCW